ncbi:MAG: GntR family transcriptional regulator [Propionibacteriaceae bacterium]|jgi:DNA-binding GntR family transcriptional regulator|nr:GntR family transcriptional regulator [Propionibacteriaceae bacterium]
MGTSRVESLRQQLTELIAARGLKPGDKLPTEADLASEFSAGRSTVREALKHLEEAGLVISARGRGRFVSAVGGVRVERPITRYEGLGQLLRAQGLEVSRAVLDVGLAAADAAEAEALSLPTGAEVIRLTRLFSAADEPLVFSQVAVPKGLLPGAIRHRDWSGSLNDLLAAHGHQVVSSVAVIRAVELPEPSAARFNLGGLGPWLLITETGLGANGDRLLYSLDYHRGSHAAFSILRQL